MRYASLRRFSALLGTTIAAAVLGLQVQSASAQTSSAAEEKWTVTTTNSQHGHAGKPYFIEFRGRAAANYGHLYVLYGRVNARDEIISSRIAGLHPAGDAADCYNCSLFNWTIGHLVPVPSETGASDGDLEEKYVTARYRVWLTPAQFKDIDAYIRKLQADNPTWNALFNNCVEFGRSIAEHMRLKLPAFVWLEPKDFVDGLREMNGMKAEQLPLKDAGASGAAVKRSASVAPLPPQKPATQPVSQSQPATKPVAKPKKPVASVPQTKPVASAPQGEQSPIAAIFKREQVMATSAAQ
jgi:hypothetical protein